MERVTYRPTVLQAGVWWGGLALLVVVPQLLPPAGWDRSLVLLGTGTLLLGALLFLEQGLRIDDRGITVLRGPVRRRVPWDEVTAVEESCSGTGRRFLVVITTRTVLAAPFPADGRLLRDDAFGRKRRQIQQRVAEELHRRSVAAP